MNYNGFKKAISGFVEKTSDPEIDVFFYKDDDTGLFFARFLDESSKDVVIIGKAGSDRLTVKWGSGHMSMKSIKEAA